MSDLNLAVAYYLNGTNFRMSAEHLQNTLDLDSDGRATKLTAIPLFFLASHAAELFLKAALLKRGVTEAVLKEYDYRHNLAGLLSALQAKGVPVTAETVGVVNGLSRRATRCLRGRIAFVRQRSLVSSSITGAPGRALR
jgi:hypothetical protein